MALPCPREQPRIIRAIDERRTIVEQIIVDERGQLRFEREILTRFFTS
jgi:ATP-dependent phosphoenolpyruvate carboxykinase